MKVAWLPKLTIYKKLSSERLQEIYNKNMRHVSVIQHHFKTPVSVEEKRASSHSAVFSFH
jgi:hypothetical protein